MVPQCVRSGATRSPAPPRHRHLALLFSTRPHRARSYRTSPSHVIHTLDQTAPGGTTRIDLIRQDSSRTDRDRRGKGPSTTDQGRTSHPGVRGPAPRRRRTLRCHRLRICVPGRPQSDETRPRIDDDQHDRIGTTDAAPGRIGFDRTRPKDTRPHRSMPLNVRPHKT